MVKEFINEVEPLMGSKEPEEIAEAERINGERKKLVTEAEVRYIVDTFELPEKLREKIVLVAKYRLNKLVIIDFDRQYEEIAEIVYRYTGNYYEQHLITSLDKPVGRGDNKVPLHELIAAKDRVLQEDEKGLEKVVVERDSRHLSLIIETIHECLNPSLVPFLFQLIRQTEESNFLFEITPGQVQRNAALIENRITQIADKYSRGDKLVLPPRQIKTISFDPLTIKFVRRQFKGKPIDYFREHADIYAGLTRKGLQDFDLGIYDALIREKQIDGAIPEKNKRKYRGFDSALAYFQAHPELHFPRRVDLIRADKNLYARLLANGWLDQAIPAKRGDNYRGFPSALAYFQEHPELHKLGRGKLARKDSGLYQALTRRGKLQSAIPKNNNYGRNPLEYFRAHPELHGLRRCELRKANPNLYARLYYRQQLDKAIPKKYGQEYRGFPGPLEYFQAHPELRGLGRGELAVKDKGLYRTLKRRGQLDHAIPLPKK